MGTYVNPRNNGFRKKLKSGDYIDKTGMIAFMFHTS